jgi:hypothetical protein
MTKHMNSYACRRQIDMALCFSRILLEHESILIMMNHVIIHRRQVKNNLLFLAVFTEFIVMEHVAHDRTTRDVLTYTTKTSSSLI